MDENRNNQDENVDEYEYGDLDLNEPELEDSAEHEESEKSTPSSNMPEINKDILQKALFVIGAFVVIVIIYKFLGAIFSSSPAPKPVVAVTPNPMPAAFQPGPVMAAPTPEVTKKLAALEVTEQSLTSEVAGINSQVATITASVTDLNTKVDQLSQAINALAAQVAEQSQQIALLTAREKHRAERAVRHYTKKAHSTKPVYFIQAVIPGRAWLISTTGITITVRDGTNIPGYGIVKLINPNEGRILTSSGRVIMFSQQDS